MSRVLLVMAPLPQRLGAPYLGQQYVAASLLAAGHDVKVLDLAARFWPRDALGEPLLAPAIELASAFGPDVIGVTMFTYGAARGYRLAAALRGMARLLVAGGPHPTVCPREPLNHGFDVSLSGEGERAMLALVDALGAGTDLHAIPGVHTASGAGPAWATDDDLNTLDYPHHAAELYDSHWYLPEGGPTVPGGLMTSRGCPARCTFCANYVTGRSYRFRSADNVAEEMRHLRNTRGVTHFPFWDDAFTALRPRLNALCDVLTHDPDLKDVTWTCITPGNMVKPFDLERMREAGCVGINFGLESGDAHILKVIQKGQRPAQVRAAVHAAKACGMTTVVNFMFGFPEEGVAELQSTLDVMEELAPSVDFYNNRGVLVPFPGTAIFDAHQEAYDLHGWWLDPEMVPLEPDLHAMTAEESQASLAVDPTLALDFFGYTDEVRDKIAECVAYKAHHNGRAIERLTRPRS